MKRCNRCRVEYSPNHIVCPADGTRLVEAEQSRALAPIIEIQTSDATEGELDRHGACTLIDDFREFLEDQKVHKISFSFGAHGIELLLSRAAVSVALFCLGVAALGVGFLALIGHAASDNLWHWLPELLFSVGLVSWIGLRKGISPGAAMVVTGIALLARRFTPMDLNMWRLLMVAAGGLSLAYRRCVHVSRIRVKFDF